VNAHHAYCWWSTSGLSSLQNEIITVATSGTINATYGLIGDVNHDNSVGLGDLTLFAVAYPSRQGSPNWNPECDVAPPYGIIDLMDLVTIAVHYGDHR